MSTNSLSVNIKLTITVEIDYDDTGEHDISVSTTIIYRIFDVYSLWMGVVR